MVGACVSLDESVMQSRVRERSVVWQVVQVKLSSPIFCALYPAFQVHYLSAAYTREFAATRNLNLNEVQEPENNEEIGALLKRLRGELSLRDITRRTGISSSHLSQLERGERRPGRNVLRELEETYNVDLRHLLMRAGYGPKPDPNSNEVLEVERAYRYVLLDPVFRVGTRPDGPLSLSAKRSIVEMYERFTNRKLLQ